MRAGGLAIERRILLSVDYVPPESFGRSFGSALEIRQALCGEGVRAEFFSVNVPFCGDETSVVFPIAENYLGPEKSSRPFALREFLESRQIHFIGSRSVPIYTAADKFLAKSALRRAGFEVPGGVLLQPGIEAETTLAEYLERYRFPAILKPARGLGGSTSVQWIPDRAALERSLSPQSALSESPWLIEEYVAGIEVTCWVSGSGDAARCRNIIEIDKGDRPIYSREAKVGADPARPVWPARLEAATAERVQDIAVRVHRLFGLRSYSRIDMIISGDWPVVLEINPTPTFRDNGFGIARGSGQSFGAVLAELLGEADLV